MILSFCCCKSGLLKGDKLEISKATISSLEDLRNEPKFKEDESIFYPGAPDEIIRKRAEGSLNILIDNLIQNIQANPKKSYVIKQFQNTLAQYNNFDSEEQDRICSYLEEIMNILKIESSDGLLNKWRYGTDVK